MSALPRSMYEYSTPKIIRTRRRTICLQIKPDGALVVRAPLRVDTTYINRLIEKKKDWIAKKRGLFTQQPRKTITSAEKKLLFDKARRVISQRASHYSCKANSPYKRIRISRARSRWGSCGVKGTLNFSWRLILAPLEVIDYVVAHEVAHLRIKNHSREFWAWVEELFPDYRKMRKWLKANSYLLAI